MLSKKGVAFGVFDIFHVGHVRYLQTAAKNCQELYVGIRSDELKTPGKNRTTYFTETIRLEMILSLSCVKEAFVFYKSLDESAYYLDWFSRNNIDIVFVGEDWKASQRWKRLEPLLNNIDIKVHYIKRTESISSTEILSKIKKDHEG